MGKKILKSPVTKISILTVPIDVVKNVTSYINYCIVYRPAFTVFMCTLFVFITLIISNQKLQNSLTNFPYEKYFTKFKSRKMITIYATILEIFIEIFMNVVLAGVSLIVTLWLLFEEVTEKKENKETM
ncbi:hypothetical protein Phum_PHUM062670 [Pediculus humanus corporis]|uniref:Uncharacterized protein n=1 Tax=Pediculus humanus subsp. corporis TaxID=121224 RepID=E0VBJ4_PEDHC|nr:uncharacterized protein Phum_PHUM062670 [Pediculus humanus corporis]EEB10750.1 hypothetical protein Phum_PHUM062670 [Pediculus humanus corporis]